MLVIPIQAAVALWALSLLLWVESCPAAVNWPVTNMTHHHSMPYLDPTSSHLASVLGLLPPPIPSPCARAYASSSSQGRDAVHQDNPLPRSPFQETHTHTHGRTKAAYMLDPSRDKRTFVWENFAAVDTKEMGVQCDLGWMNSIAIRARTWRTTETSLRPPVGGYLVHCVYVRWRMAERARPGLFRAMEA